jgi:aspartyl-tRNA(Asn)/glutamyl-tRNA(Gln) amidotransferase subunit A
VISGQDSMDSTTISNTTYPKKEVKDKMVIGIPYHILEKGGMSSEARKVFDDAVERLKTLGYEIKDIKLSNIEYSLAVYYIIMPAEASSNLARFDGVRFGLHVDGANLLEDYMKTKGQGFGKETRRRILIGTYVLSAGYHDAYYNKALQVRQTISKDFEKAFAEVDAILTPTTTGPAFKIGEKANDPLALYLEDIFTVPANIVGIPAISIPSGKVNSGDVELPLGIQIMAPHSAENILFSISKKFLNE